MTQTTDFETFATRIRAAHKHRLKKEPDDVNIYTWQGEAPNPAHFEADSIDREANTRTHWTATSKRVRHFRDYTLTGPIPRKTTEAEQMRSIYGMPERW